MGEFIVKAWQHADYVMLTAFGLFWLRWELWTRTHNREHAELETKMHHQPRKKAHA